MCPGERYQFLLAHVFAEHEGSTLLGPGSDFDQLLIAFSHFGITPERIAELRDVIAATLTRGGNGLLAYLSPTLSTRLTDALNATRAAPTWTWPHIWPLRWPISTAASERFPSYGSRSA